MTSLSKKLLFIVIPALVIIMGLLGALLIMPDSSAGKVYVEQISEARKLRESGDYQKAIICYKNAIQKDDTQEDSYLELATIYFLLNMREEGLQTLREGINKTSSIKLTEELERYEGMDNIEKFASIEKIDFNAAYTDVFASYNYEKYTKECTVKDEQISADCYTVVYGQYDASFEYKNSAENEVFDVASGKPYPYARPTAIKMNKIGQVIIGAENGVTVDALKAAGASDVNVQPFNKELDTCLVTFDYSSLKFTVGCDEAGTIKGEDVYNTIVPKPGESTAIEKVTVTGKITDSSTGKTVSDVSIKIRQGKDNESGKTVVDTKSKEGEYSIELEPGDYTWELSGDKYETLFYNMYLADNSDTFNKDFEIKAKRGKGIRFEVEWEQGNYNTFIHMKGYASDGKWYEYVYGQDNEFMGAGEIGERDGKKYESATIFDTAGKFEFHVHGETDKQDVIKAGTVVKIYEEGSSTPIDVHVPSSFSGGYWIVCKIENGKVTNINGAS